MTIDILSQLAIKYGTDKGPLFHNYTRHYGKYFAPLRMEPLRILEIGIFKGESLAMWREYFPNARLFAVDIDPECRKFASEGSYIYIGDQGDPVFLEHVIRESGGNFDIIIDDGGHTMAQQAISFNVLFPHLKPGGIYAVEDLHTSYWSTYGGGFKQSGTFIEFLKGLVDTVNLNGLGGTGDTVRAMAADGDFAVDCYTNPNDKYYKEHIESIHCHLSIAFIFKRKEGSQQEADDMNGSPESTNNSDVMSSRSRLMAAPLPQLESDANADMLFKAALYSKNHGYYRNAYELLDRLLKTRAMDRALHAEACIHQGEVCRLLGLKNWRQYYKKSLDLMVAKPKKTPLEMYRIASLCKQLHRITASKKWFRRVIDHAEDTNLLAGSYFHLGELFYMQMYFEKAGQYLGKCLILNPSHRKAHDYLQEIDDNYAGSTNPVEYLVRSTRSTASIVDWEILEERGKNPAPNANSSAPLIRNGLKKDHVTIVIPVSNQASFTRACLQSIIENTDSVGSGISYDIVVVDNNSTDGTAAMMREFSRSHKHIHHLFNRENLGFGEGCNAGAAAASGEYVLFLNNDTRVLPGWLSPLIEPLKTDPDIGAVGPKLVYPDDTIQSAGMVFGEPSKIPYHLYQGMSKDDPCVNKKRYLQILAGACFSVRTVDFYHLKGFDPIYQNGAEDGDFCLKMRTQLKKKLLYHPGSMVYHYEGKTQGRGRYVAANRHIFAHRWLDSISVDDKAIYEADGFQIKNYKKNGHGENGITALYYPQLVALKKRDDKVNSITEDSTYGLPYVSPGHFDDWIRIYLTLKCNLSCPYCVNEQGILKAGQQKFQLRTVDEWAETINRIGRNVIFTGGEPTLYPRFPELLNRIDPTLEVKVYTNLKFNVDAFIPLINRPLTFYVSYHAGYGPVESFIQEYKKLKPVPHFKSTVHAILVDGREKYLEQVTEAFARNGLRIDMDDDQLPQFEGCKQLWRQRVRCEKMNLLIAPDGTRYPCASKLFRQEDPMENVIDEPLGEMKFENLCDDYGYCAACDALGHTRIHRASEK